MIFHENGLLADFVGGFGSYLKGAENEMMEFILVQFRCIHIYTALSKKKNPLFVFRWDGKSILTITICHHSASLVMPNGDPRNGFFYPTRTLMMNSYITLHSYPEEKYIIYYCEL